MITVAPAKMNGETRRRPRFAASCLAQVAWTRRSCSASWAARITRGALVAAGADPVQVLQRPAPRPQRVRRAGLDEGELLACERFARHGRIVRPPPHDARFPAPI